MRIFDPPTQTTYRTTGDEATKGVVAVRELGDDSMSTQEEQADAMLAAGLDADDVDKVLWRNPVEFHGQGGRRVMDGAPAAAESTARAEGSAVFVGDSVLPVAGGLTR